MDIHAYLHYTKPNVSRRLVIACTPRKLVPPLMHACSPLFNIQTYSTVLACVLEEETAAAGPREDGSGLQPLDDVCSYSTVDNAWQIHTMAGQSPSARNAAIACVVADRRMLLHGGWDPFKQTYSDSFILQSEAAE